MHVFVTGAAGFIGWNLVRLLLVRGHRVTALVHASADLAKFGKMEHVVVGDVTRPEMWTNAAKDSDAIVHLALPDILAKYAEALPAWVNGTRFLVDIAVERGMRAFVLASGAGGTYRHEPGDWIDETTPEEPISKEMQGRAYADTIVRGAHRDHGLKGIILRPNTVYGPGGAFEKYFVDLMRKGRYRVVGNGANYWPFIHIQDCAMAYALAVERSPAGETFLLADDTPVTLREASDLIADAYGFPRPGSVPASIARLAIGALSVRLITESFRIRNAKAKDRLDWTPTRHSLKNGLQFLVHRDASKGEGFHP